MQGAPSGCARCGRELEQRRGRGRPRKYCDRRCQSSAERARIARRLALGVLVEKRLMSEGVGTMEYASENRTLGVFPAEWGVPAGSQFSEERAAWVRERVAEHRAMEAVRRKAKAVASAASGQEARQRPVPRAPRVTPPEVAAARRRVELLQKRER